MQKFYAFRSLVNLSKFTASGAHAETHKKRPARSDLMTDQDVDRHRHFINSQPLVKDRLFSATYLLPKISVLYNPILIKFFATSFDSVKADSLSDVYYPPKIHENGTHIYSTIHFGRAFRYARSIECLYLGFLLTTANPLFFISIGAFAYTIFFNAWFYEFSRRLVIRMDLLPHTQQIAVQKVGAFGQVLTKLIKIEDLEYVNFSELEQKENYFWQMHYRTLDVHLIFRDKTTGEILTFEKQGLWDREALNHELLN